MDVRHRLAALARLASAAAAASCAVVGSYDFDGYVLMSPQTTTETEADSSTRDSGACTAQTCAELGAECGKVSNGCGDRIDCGSCETGVCGGSGPNKCGTDPCSPRSCADIGASCGEISDGCGGTVQCGHCPANETCGGGGTSKKCGCTPS